MFTLTVPPPLSERMAAEFVPLKLSESPPFELLELPVLVIFALFRVTFVVFPSDEA